MTPLSPRRRSVRTSVAAAYAAMAALLSISLLSGCIEAQTSPPLGSPQEPSAELPEAPRSLAEGAVDGQESAAEGPATSEAPIVVVGSIARVVDGDTAHIVIDGVREKVRFIGIDTPESTREIEPYGKAAASYTAAKLAVGSRVWVETDAELRDRYGRLLAYVWLERPESRSDAEIRAKMLNAQLAIDGYAQQMTFPPNVRYVDHFQLYVREAREAERGLWADDEGSSLAPSPDPGATPGSVASPDAVVFVTRTGQKYHLEGCGSLRRSRIPATLAEAKERGYEPCKLCDPPR